MEKEGDLFDQARTLGGHLEGFFKKRSTSNVPALSHGGLS